MPLTLERRRTQALPDRTDMVQPRTCNALRIGLINNMPDAALQSTEAQFCGLLEAASANATVSVRLSSFPELPRGPEALERIASEYWPLERLLAEGLDALIVTGTEPRAARLSDEPYWGRFAQLLSWAERNTRASIWSCLAAHAAVEILDGIERRRLPEKRAGVFDHAVLEGHPLLRGTAAPLHMPHSRWNELPLERLQTANYTILSWSPVTGADTFILERESLLLFFQGHPEYEATTLLKEYRRDVGRFLAGTQNNYPTVPAGYFSDSTREQLEDFRREAVDHRSPELLERFPFARVAAALRNTWQASATALYRNWLSVACARKAALPVAEALSLA
jgi:homoserine O-succinyltransferase/O-acetyltransferase